MNNYISTNLLTDTASDKKVLFSFSFFLKDGKRFLRDVLFSSLLLQSITKQAGFQIVVAPAANESNLALDHRVNKLSTLYFRA